MIIEVVMVMVMVMVMVNVMVMAIEMVIVYGPSLFQLAISPSGVKCQKSGERRERRWREIVLR